MGNLWDPDSGILTARMMGSKHTVLIVFSGSHIPRWVNYRGVMVRCAPYKPRAQFCTVCSGLGHRADVCPNTEVIKCLKCGLTLNSQNQPHTCRVGCPHCGGDNQAGDSRCEVRAAADRTLRQTESARVYVVVFLTKISEKRYNPQVSSSNSFHCLPRLPRWHSSPTRPPRLRSLAKTKAQAKLGAAVCPRAAPRPPTAHPVDQLARPPQPHRLQRNTFLRQVNQAAIAQLFLPVQPTAPKPP
ncbi:hypothetical protein HPB49_023673 [Dermacentor silvarum]|uniref:Uncharacterized protein n=1 Tax=Dermacentor silvarum TaxID=543639 RepID=A0ACB8DGR3_DERSI|nr:hypothetical protein HPB49_023673 [Dermacentor silvarum]